MEFVYRLGEKFDLIGGGTPSTAKKDYWGSGVPWVSSADIDASGQVSIRREVTEQGIQNSTTNKVPEGTIVVVTRVGLGKVAKLPMDMCFSQDIQALSPKNASLSYDQSFLMYQLLHIMSYQRYSGRGTTISGISKKQLSDLKIYLPPREEQERIVNRIEEMFSELDKAVESLQTIRKQLEIYRQAVLNEAFLQIKNKEKIVEMSDLVTSGSRGWAKFYADDGALFIRIGNLTRTTIDISFDDIQYVALPEKVEGIRSRLRPNDVLVSITADLGSIGFVPEGIGEAYINQHIAMIRFKNSKQGKLMAWYLRSEYGQKDLLKNKRGGGKLGLGLDDIRNTRVPHVTNLESDELVEKIEMKLSVCEKISETVNAALKQSDALRKSILKHAFEGRLI